MAEMTAAEPQSAAEYDDRTIVLAPHANVGRRVPKGRATTIEARVVLWGGRPRHSLSARSPRRAPPGRLHRLGFPLAGFGGGAGAGASLIKGPRDRLRRGLSRLGLLRGCGRHRGGWFRRRTQPR